MHKTLSFLTLSCLLIILLSNCRSDGSRDIRNYYFPLKNLQEGMVYEYQPVGMDSLSPAYWYYRSILNEEGIFLTGTYYDFQFTPLQFAREEMVSNGMIQEDLFLYETDSTGRQKRVDVDILAGNIFPFNVREEGGIFLYKIKWQLAFDSTTQITLIKNRRYLGDTTFVYDGKKYDCVKFEVKELFEHEQEGSLEQQFTGEEWYAKGLGLIYYRKEINPEFVLEYVLADRYPMTGLEEKFRVFMEQEEMNNE